MAYSFYETETILSAQTFVFLKVNGYTFRRGSSGFFSFFPFTVKLQWLEH